MFKVYLPNQEGFVSVIYNKDTKVQHVLETVCVKRDLKMVRAFIKRTARYANVSADPLVGTSMSQTCTTQYVLMDDLQEDYALEFDPASGKSGSISMDQTLGLCCVCCGVHCKDRQQQCTEPVT
jgi:hypothetical protein